MLFRIVQRLTQITPGRASPLRLCPLDAYRPLPGEEGRSDLAPPNAGPAPGVPAPPPCTRPAVPLMFGPASSRSR